MGVFKAIKSMAHGLEVPARFTYGLAWHGMAHGVDLSPLLLVQADLNWEGSPKSHVLSEIIHENVIYG